MTTPRSNLCRAVLEGSALAPSGDYTVRLKTVTMADHLLPGLLGIPAEVMQIIPPCAPGACESLPG